MVWALHVSKRKKQHQKNDQIGDEVGVFHFCFGKLNQFHGWFIWLIIDQMYKIIDEIHKFILIIISFLQIYFEPYKARFYIKSLIFNRITVKYKFVLKAI